MKPTVAKTLRNRRQELLGARARNREGINQMRAELNRKEGYDAAYAVEINEIEDALNEAHEPMEEPK